LKLGIILGVPLAFITSRVALSKRINQCLVLYTFIILLAGLNTLNSFDKIGETEFLISDVIFGIFDLSTGVLCQSMIFTKLKPDSRGVISSLILASTTIFGII